MGMLKFFSQLIAISICLSSVLGASIGNTKPYNEDGHWREALPERQYEPYFRSSYSFPHKNRQIYTSKTFYGSSQFQGLPRPFNGRVRQWWSPNVKSYDTHYQPYYLTDAPTSNLDDREIKVSGFPPAEYPNPYASNVYEPVSKEISGHPFVGYPNEDTHVSTENIVPKNILSFPQAEHSEQGPNSWNENDQISGGISRLPVALFPDQGKYVYNEDQAATETVAYPEAANPDQGVNVWSDQVSRGISDYPVKDPSVLNVNAQISTGTSRFPSVEYLDSDVHALNEHHNSKETVFYSEKTGVLLPDQDKYVSNEGHAATETAAYPEAVNPDQGVNVFSGDQVSRGISDYPKAEYPANNPSIWNINTHISTGASRFPSVEYPGRDVHSPNENHNSEETVSYSEKTGALFPDQGKYVSNEGHAVIETAAYPDTVNHDQAVNVFSDDQVSRGISDYPEGEYPDRDPNVWNVEAQIPTGISGFPSIEYPDHDFSNENLNSKEIVPHPEKEYPDESANAWVDQVAGGISNHPEAPDISLSQSVWDEDEQTSRVMPESIFVEYPDQDVQHASNGDLGFKEQYDVPKAEYPDPGSNISNDEDSRILFNPNAASDFSIEDDYSTVPELGVDSLGSEIPETSSPHLDAINSEYYDYEDFPVDHQMNNMPESLESNDSIVDFKIPDIPQQLNTHLTENGDEFIDVNASGILNSHTKEGSDMTNGDHEISSQKDGTVDAKNLSVTSEFISSSEDTEDGFQTDPSENPVTDLELSSVSAFNELDEDEATSLMDIADGSGELDESNDEPLHDEPFDPSKSGRIIDIFPSDNSTTECTTPKGENGHCRTLTQCPLSESLDNHLLFLQYVCLVKGIFIGICCPDNPVIEISDKTNNSTELKEISQPPEGCGLSSNTRIVGGKVSVPHEWNWMVALMRRNRFYCGGVIINDWYILTAAHCVMGIQLKDLSVRIGEHNFNEKNDHQQDIPVAEVKQHAMFVILTFQHDIALLRLKRRIKYTKFIGSICLPSEGRGDFSNENATVVGWGTLSFGGSASPVLRQVTVPVWRNEDCDRTYLFERITDSFLCAGTQEDGEDACQGDSGGPLMALNDEGRWELIGIVSWGRRCGDPRYPGVYTRITSYLDWISKNAN